MRIRDLIGDDYDIKYVPEVILDMETECRKAMPIHHLFKGVLLYEGDGKEVSINLEDDDEFARMAMFEYDDEGYIVSETGFDDEGNVLYVSL